MYTVRCSICRQQMPTLKLLISHYITSHSKLKIIKELLKCSALLSTPNLLKFKYKNKAKRELQTQKAVIKFNPNYVKTETLYLNENVHILCSPEEIIIGDEKSNVDMEFSFEDTSDDSKENNNNIPLKNGTGTIIPKKKIRLNKISNKSKINVDSNIFDTSSSASSEDNKNSLQEVKRRMKRKKESLGNMRHYHINVTKLKDQKTLDEENGEFYMCDCREKFTKDHVALQKNDLRIITSDTESCSEASKSMSMLAMDTRIFCHKCGNGYHSENELADHMQIHETFCRLCNEYFPNEYVFKEHMRLHIIKVYMCHMCGREFPFRDLLQTHFDCHVEDRTFETVLDMEDEYRINRYNFTSLNYNSSINSIMCYLSESHDIYYYGYKLMKVICEICFVEVFLCDYELHLQNIHYVYNY